MEIIKTRAYNKTVIGEITDRAENGVTVRILEPYSGLSSNDFIFKSKEFDVDFRSKEGIKIARRMLRSIYIICLEVCYRKSAMETSIRNFESELEFNKTVRWKLEMMLKERMECYKNEQFIRSFQMERMHALQETITILTNETRQLFQAHFKKHFHLGITKAGELSMLTFIKAQIGKEIFN